MRIFVDDIDSEEYTVNGQDAIHIKKSLRMRPGEIVTLCDKDQFEYIGRIFKIKDNEIFLKIESKKASNSEPPVNIILYQGLTKGEKMDFVVQKAVEMGVSEIVPLVLSRCISHPDNKSVAKKVARWQKIAKEAAMQSKRAKIPKVLAPLNLKEAMLREHLTDCKILCYENGGEKIGKFLEKSPDKIALFIGPEGGFSFEEVEIMQENNCYLATLGQRILRTETAPIAALANIIYFLEN